MKLIAFTALALTAALAVPALAEPTDAPVTNIMAGYLAAWARADAPGLASAFADDGVFVNPNGDRFEGRAAISAFYAAAFSRGYAGSQGSAHLSEVRQLSPGVLLARGEWSISGARDAKGPRAPECGGVVMVARRDTGGGDHWSIAYLQENEGRCP